MKSESVVNINIKEESSKAAGGSKTTPLSAQGPVKEEEFRAVLLQRSPLTTSELVTTFKARLKSPEKRFPLLISPSQDKKAFAKNLKRISMLQKTNSNHNYIVLSKLSKSGKELKKLLGRSNGLNGSDGHEKEDGSIKRNLVLLIAKLHCCKLCKGFVICQDDVDHPSPILAPKLKDPTEEASNSSRTISAAGKFSRGTPTSNLAKGKRKNGDDDSKPASGSALKKIKSESDVKPNRKDESSKTSGGSKVTPSCAQGMADTSSAQGPIKEEEIMAVLLQRSPVTTSELVATFEVRLKSPEDKKAFAVILWRISKIQKMNNNQNYVVLRK